MTVAADQKRSKQFESAIRWYMVEGLCGRAAIGADQVVIGQTAVSLRMADRAAICSWAETSHGGIWTARQEPWPERMALDLGLAASRVRCVGVSRLVLVTIHQCS